MQEREEGVTETESNLEQHKKCLQHLRFFPNLNNS